MKTTTISKSVLKENNSCYYECNDWYDKCPSKLSVPEFKTEIFTRSISHDDILKEYNITPYASYAEATAVCASIIFTLKNDYKSRIVYFKDNDVLYRFFAWRDDDGQLDVLVREVDLDYEFDPEDGVCFNNGILGTSPDDTLPLNSFVPHAPQIKKVYCYCEQCVEFYKEWNEGNQSSQ